MIQIGTRIVTKSGYPGVVVAAYDDFSAVSALQEALLGPEKSKEYQKWLTYQTTKYEKTELVDVWYRVRTDINKELQFTPGTRITVQKSPRQ